MTVKVKFFASLSEQLGIKEKEIVCDSQLTVVRVWNKLINQPVPENLLCAINLEYAQLDQVVVDGDEVAFFPPVNGG